MKKNNQLFKGLDAFATAHPMDALNLAGDVNYRKTGFGSALLERISAIIAKGDTGDEFVATLKSLRDIQNGPLKESFLLRLAQDARAHTSERLNSGNPKALLGTTPIINLSTIAQSLRQAGVDATTLCFSTYYITEKFDVNLSVQNSWISENRPEFWDDFRFMVFIWSYINFDLFFYYNDCGILCPGGYGHANFGINTAEMQSLVAAGKRLYTLTYGADNRTRQATLASGKYNFCMHCPEPGKFCICDDVSAAKVLDTIDQYATAMLASGLSVDYIPNCYELHYLVIDTDEVRAEPLDESEGPLRILHAPNHGFFKGSDYLKASVKTLQDQGVAIELELISGKSNAEVLEAMRRSHVVADQFIGGAYGQTAIEAMARGRPTLCYLKYPERAVDPESLPIINTDPDKLVETLRRLAETPRSELADLGRKSRAYVENHHSIEALSGRLGQLLTETADLPETVRLSTSGTEKATLPDPANLNARTSYLEARRRVRHNLETLLNGVFNRLGDGNAGDDGEPDTAPLSVMDGILEVYRGLSRLDRQQDETIAELRHQATTILNFVDAKATKAAQESDARLARLQEMIDRRVITDADLLSALNNTGWDQQVVSNLVDAVHAVGGTTRNDLIEALESLLSAMAVAREAEFDSLRSMVVDSVYGAGASIKSELTGLLQSSLDAAGQARAREGAKLTGAVVDAVHASAAATRPTLVDAVMTSMRDAHQTRMDEAEALRRDVIDALHATANAESARKAEELQGKLEALTGQLAASNSEKLALESDLALWQTRAEAAEAERLSLSQVFERQVEALKAEQDDIARLFERQAEAVRAERDDIARLFERQAEAVRAERDKTAVHAAALQERIAAIESSFSWRVTGPIRLMSSAFPMLGRGLQWLARRLVSGIRKVLSVLARPVRWVLDPVLARAWPVRRPHRTSRERKTLYPVNARSTSEWLEEFRKLNGRNLKVLHIGNIANNAYNNAKIQRQRGIDADVLCNDYYHIMACPEWEDGTFKRSIENDNFPDWWRAGLQNYKRPDWFAQGPLDASIRYLVAHSAGARSAKFLWRWLTFERWMLCHPSILARVIRRLALKATGRVIQYDGGPANGILWSYFGAKMLKWSEDNATKWPRLAPKVKATGKRLSRFALTADPMRAVIRHLNRTQKRREAVRERLDGLLGGRENIPSVDWHFNWWYHPYMPLLFNRYDVVQAYATYTAMPFILDHDYVAYEHGTIRAIPFQNTDEGKLCMATYRAADAVFVTNTDNLDSADRMGLDPARVSALPHAFDSDKLLRFQRASRVSPPKGITVFFTPARQHWVDGDPGWAKGNDRIIHALRILKDQCLTCRLDAIEWGVDVPASRALAAELGVEHMVNWLPKLKKRDLWGTYLASHAILDQFVAPAFGGVTFEALMLGRRVITAVDDVEMARFFGDPPPLYNCRTAEEIAAAMAKVINDPEDLSGDGRRNQEWMQIRHSADTIVGIQVERYRNHGDIAKAVASHAGALEIIPDVELPAE